MELKRPLTAKSNYSYLDLLGNNEVALSKAFAYLLAHDKECYFRFLHYLGIKVNNKDKNYLNSSVDIEKKRDEGRTDIELKQGDKYHVIIECKIKKGKTTKQKTQYITAFHSNVKKKVLCLLTQERDTNKQIPNDVIVRNTTWLDIIELYNNKNFTDKKSVKDFLKFTTKNYRMSEIKEILVQDLKGQEIKRFEEYYIYRRDVQFGAPLYFAPYYTRSVGIKEGISKLSKILGTLTIKKSEIDSLISDLDNFSKDKTLIDRWIEGVKFGNDNQHSLHTYYFLDTPYCFDKPLLKAGGKKGGSGQNWIIKNITPNRCVTFLDFIKHIPEFMHNTQELAGGK